VKPRVNGSPVTHPTQAETLDHLAAVLIAEDRPAWAFMVSTAAEALAGRRMLRPAELDGLLELLDYVAEVMVARERPAWARQVVDAADTLRARRPAPPRKVR